MPTQTIRFMHFPDCGRCPPYYCVYSVVRMAMTSHGLTPEPPTLGEVRSPNPSNGLRVGVEDWAHVDLGLELIVVVRLDEDGWGRAGMAAAVCNLLNLAWLLGEGRSLCPDSGTGCSGRVAAMGAAVRRRPRAIAVSIRSMPRRTDAIGG
jgi:hypothetical protein